MKNQKMYEADDKMISIIRDNYNILQSLGSFGINLALVIKLCAKFAKNSRWIPILSWLWSIIPSMVIKSMTMPTVCRYRPFCIISRHPMSIILISSCLSSVRNSLRLWMKTDNLARLILKLYDDYAHSITNHMQYEEKMVFPYVQALIDGNANASFDIETFSKHHAQVDMKLKELKSIIIKYLPSDACIIISSAPLFMIYIIMRNAETSF